MGLVARKSLEVEGPQVWKALGVTLGFDLFAIVFVFVLPLIWPTVWPIVVLAVLPYFGGRLGGRYVDPPLAMRIGILGAVVMITIIAYMFLSILAGLPGESFNLFEPIGFSILALGYFLGIVFGAIGGRHGATLAVENG
jgi:hypothetical protein